MSTTDPEESAASLAREPWELSEADGAVMRRGEDPNDPTGKPTRPSKGLPDVSRDYRIELSPGGFAICFRAANLRLEMAREAARWLAMNPPGTPVPDWIDAVVSPPGISDGDLEDYRTAKTRGRGVEGA